MFYENLKRICNEQKTSPTAVAVAIGMSKSNATGWKRGKSPKLATVMRIASHLGVTPSSLISDKEVQ